MATVDERPLAPQFAVLSPHAAQWIGRQLRRAGITSANLRADAAWRRQLGRDDLAVELEAGWRQLVSSARLAVTESTSVDGSAEAGSAEAAAGSEREVTTIDAAGALGVTCRRIGQLLREGKLSGRKVGRAWLVDAASLDAYRDVRRSA